MNLESNGRNRDPNSLQRNCRVLVICLLTILFLGSVANQLSLAFGHASGKTLQAWASSPPTINGEILDSEWENANPLAFSLTIDGNPYSGTFYAMNDASNLYIAIKIADDDFNTVAPEDAAAVYFDNDNDGTFEPGDDSVAQYAGAVGFRDRFLQAGPSIQIDTDFGGTSDGSGACAWHGGYNHFEFSHPLNSLDDAHDFSLVPSNTVGFTMAYRDGGLGVNLGHWPALTTPDATGWGDIVIASAPPSLTAWSPTPPIIDGVMGATEWTSASHASIAIGWTFSGDVWLMNDADNLYLAVKLADSSLADPDQVWIGFDNDNDGTVEVGDDILVWSVAEAFQDGFWDGSLARKDTVFGGTNDGAGSASNAVDFNYFELRHPLNSADDAHDFSLSAGNTVGFVVGYWTTGNYWGYWPESPPTPLSKGWAHYTVAMLAPDFSIACVPPSLTLAQGSSATSTCTVTSLNAFSSPVDLSGSWLGAAPTGVTPSPLPSPITPTSGGTASSTLTIGAAPDASIGTFTFRVTATSGALTHTADVGVEIVAGAADFAVAVSPPSLSIGPGGSATTTVTVQSTGVFSSPVTLSAPGAPSGLNLVFGTNPVLPPAGSTASSVLTITVAGAATGAHTITITGTSGTLTHSTTLTVTVTGAGAGCLIATATYGSELSDEVQFLRHFRDNSILRTNTGSNFMAAFNAWYYSFSPSVAQLIREHSTLRTVMKSALYPLIGILRLGASAFYLFPTNLEAGAVVSGLLVSSLIGVVYLALPLAAVLACSSRASRMARRLQLPLMFVLFSTIAAVALTAAVEGPAILMMLATSTLVLASLLASALFASRAVARIAKRV